jgi:hypothetical protein
MASAAPFLSVASLVDFVCAVTSGRISHLEDKQRKNRRNPCRIFFESYVSDLYKLRQAFYDDLASTARELSQVMDDYSRLSEAALTSFMDKVASRGVELEAAAAARLDQFRGLPAARLPNVNDRPLARAPPADQVKTAAAGERAVADELRIENDEAHRPRSGRAIALVRSEPAA